MTADDVKQLLALLERTHALDPYSDEFLSVERAAAHLEKSAKKKRKIIRRKIRSAQDSLINCYVCKRERSEAHSDYSWMCVDCGERSGVFRELALDLTGRRALLTGGRVKVGQATALRLLRSGADVTITTRFPTDAAQRFAAEPDVDQWRDRLHIVSLDFRALGTLVDQIDAWNRGPAFDILINNAAQSVWHPREVFERLYAGEAKREAVEALALSPKDLASIDLDRVDSWILPLGELRAIDVVEVQVVNAIAPALIVNGLLENLRRSEFPKRFIINVSALEGQFNRTKASRHPHTNMAKAGLNMMTRTSAEPLARDGIFMVSVDPGWISREGAHVPEDAEVPLSPEDAAARVLQPIAAGLAGAPVVGVLLKDFHEVPW